MQKLRIKQTESYGVQFKNNKDSILELIDFLAEDTHMLANILTEVNEGEWIVKEADGYSVFKDSVLGKVYDKIPMQTGYASTTPNGYGVDINDFNNTSIRSWQEQVNDLNAYHNYLDPERNR